MATPPLCQKCGGTGWTPYYSETLDGEFEAAYRLCPYCRHQPRPCVGLKSGHPCSRPATVRYRLGYYCKEHTGVIHTYGDLDHAREAIYYLRQWLWIARDRANEFLETKLSEALGEAETWLGCAERGFHT